MENIINYYKHKLYDPSYYHRQYEHDLPSTEESSVTIASAKRVIHIALPFLSFYQPFNNTLSLTMGSIRVLTSGMGAVQADSLSQGASQVMQVTLATLALIGTLYHFTLGLYLTTSADIFTNLIHIFKALYALEYQAASEEFLQALSSSLYLGIMMTGSLEVVLASILLQASISFYQAKEEWAEGRMLEAFAKTLMGVIRLYQAHGQVEQIQRRNVLMKKYQEMIERLEKGREIDHLWDHPLIHPKGSQVILDDSEGNLYDFGSYYNGFGKQVVKGMNVQMKQEGDKTTLDFKVNHIFRDRLEQVIQHLKKTSKGDLQDLFKLFGSHIKNVTIEEKILTGPLWFVPFNETYEIKLEGLGTISVGALKDNITLYDKVTIHMEKGKSLYDFHEALSFLKLDDALRQSASSDIERMKMGFLYRIFDPKGATQFERSDPFFDLPLEAFKREICSRSEKMGQIFENYLPRLELRGTIGGKKRLAIRGLGEELKDYGVYGLTAALTGAWTEKEMFLRTASILKMGLLSSEMRNELQMEKKGLSSGTDYFTGGADTVFTQMITENTKKYSESFYWNDISFLISPKILETGTYQYHDDNFGTRIVGESNWNWFNGEYENRPTIFDFAKEENTHRSWDNEVMVKDRISPEYLMGIVVSNAQMKNRLLDYLRNVGLISKNKEGHETILSRLIEDFIHVGTAVKKEHFIPICKNNTIRKK